MRIERGGGLVNVFVPVGGPLGWTTAGVTVELAFVPQGTTPVEADWLDATWVEASQGTEAKVLLDPAVLADGDYAVKVRLTASLEQVVKTASTVIVG